MGRTQSAGNRGEAAVARYLRQKGYTLLESQWRCRFGELDLVARDRHSTVCIVEVKLRGTNSIALPREFVDSRKQQRLRSAAEVYLASKELDAPVRFDVAEVYDEGGSLRIKYIENAFIYALLKRQRNHRRFAQTE